MNQLDPKTGLTPGVRVTVTPSRPTVSPWHGELVELDARGHAGRGEWSTEVGVLVRPTMPGRGWSKTPVWLPYERVRPAVEA